MFKNHKIASSKNRKILLIIIIIILIRIREGRQNEMNQTEPDQFLLPDTDPSTGQNETDPTDPDPHLSTTLRVCTPCIMQGCTQAWKSYYKLTARVEKAY